MPDLATRPQRERELAAALLLVFSEYEDRAAAAPAAIRWGEFQRDVRDAIRDPLATTYTDANLALLLSKGQEAIEPGDQAAAWASAQSMEIASLVADRTQRQVIDAMRQTAQAGGSLADLLATTFGGSRADVIAATEVTRAISTGEAAAIVFIAAQIGTKQPAVWVTERDARVCPICAPLHQSAEEVWRIQFPSGPPAHPNCRCWLGYS